MFSFRPGTTDEQVFRDANSANELRLPIAFAPTDVIVDVSAHIGSFVHACLVRGAALILAFEGDAETFALARQNLTEYGDRVELHHRTVCGSDPSETIVAGTATVALDAILSRFERVRLLKLDCDTERWPILLTSQMLDRVDAACGSYHGLDRDTVVSFLQRHFSTVTAETDVAPSGHYWASRSPWFFVSRQEAGHGNVPALLQRCEQRLNELDKKLGEASQHNLRLVDALEKTIQQTSTEANLDWLREMLR